MMLVLEAVVDFGIITARKILSVSYTHLLPVNDLTMAFSLNSLVNNSLDLS